MLLEYMYPSNPLPETYPVNSGSIAVGFNKLINGYFDNDVMIFNKQLNKQITNNTSENSVVKIDNNNFVSLDSNLIIPFNDFDDKLTSTNNLSINFNHNINVVYDTVRYHIIAGYNLNNIDGLINTIEYEDVDGSYVVVSSTIIKKETTQKYTINPHPIKIGSEIYDKYIEVKVPNLLDMTNKYLTSNNINKINTLSSLISKSGKGFNTNSPIRINIHEIKSTSNYNGYPKYSTIRKSVLSIEREDPFKNIGATIKLSRNGDFFEFFATDDGGFIEDFILFQNSIGNSYFINHQIEVVEQIGAAFVETSNFSSIQTSAYDTVNLFRPIIRNAGIATSFILRYSMFLVNNKDNTQIIRKSSYTSMNPNKFGEKITPLKISGNPSVHKIYNKIYNPPAIEINQITEENIQIKEVIKYNNLFIDQNNITTSIENINILNNNIKRGKSNLTRGSRGIEKAYGRGKGVIYISPFDLYIKFTVYKKNLEGYAERIDLSYDGEYKLIFIDNSGNKIINLALKDNNLANPSMGELVFFIDEKTSQKIINFTNNNFYIINGNIEAKEEEEIVLKVTENIPKKSETLRLPIMANLTKSTPIPQKRKETENIIRGSVLYRGVWKNDIEEIKEEIKDIKGEIEDSLINIEPIEDKKRKINVVDSEELQTSIEKDSSIMTIGPSDNENETKTPKKILPETNDAPLGPEGQNNLQLNDSELISIISGLIQAFHTSGWTNIQIFKYFMVSGAGKKSYPMLQKWHFIEAAKDIIDLSDLADFLFEPGETIPGKGARNKNNPSK